MLEFTKINLLPYREEIEQQKKQNFKILMLCSLGISIGLCILAYLSIGREIAKQEGRNQFLEQEISKLDQNLGEIKKLQQEKKTFLEKKQKVEELQENRFKAAYIIDSLNSVIPENTYLTEIKAENPTTYTISGKTISDNKIAIFMRALPSTGIFSQPELISIKKVENTQEFTLKVLLNSSSVPSTPTSINQTASEPTPSDDISETKIEETPTSDSEIE